LWGAKKKLFGVPGRIARRDVLGRLVVEDGLGRLIRHKHRAPSEQVPAAEQGLACSRVP